MWIFLDSTDRRLLVVRLCKVALQLLVLLSNALVCNELHPLVSISYRPFESSALDEIFWLKISGQGRQPDTFALSSHRGAGICQGFFDHLLELKNASIF
jgi:hypothetical protein